MLTPIVLVTADRRDGKGVKDVERVRPKRSEVWVKQFYTDAVRAAGGLPLLVPPGETDLDRLLQLADAILLTGGDFDIHPSHYGEQQQGRLDRIEEARTTLELRIAAEGLKRRIPMLGICGGLQAMAVADGGTLVQHLSTDIIDHEQHTDDATPSHGVRLAAPATRWMGDRVDVNSTHHQAVKTVGRELVAAGWAEPDGVIEVIAHPDPDIFAVGVQWHPEALGDLRLYLALIAHAGPDGAGRGG